MTTDLDHKVRQSEASAALVEACQQGDHDAFKQLYQQYAKAMFSISMRILNDPVEAEDVLQDSFVAAFKQIHQFEGKATFGSWLKRIVINRSLDAVKKRKLELVTLDDVEVAAEMPSDEEPVEYDVATIKAAIQQLPDGFRVVLTLFLFEDHSHKMIAEELGISEGTSKSQYARARKKLVQFITQNESTK